MLFVGGSATEPDTPGNQLLVLELHGERVPCLPVSLSGHHTEGTPLYLADGALTGGRGEEAGLRPGGAPFDQHIC